MRQTTIHLPEPCHESWAAMRPTGADRHCAACQKTVVDFTSMTDGEVVAFLRQSAEVSCGRFLASQLSRPLLAAARPVAGWRRWLGTTLALLGLGSLAAPKAQAQTGPGAVPHGGPVPMGAGNQASSPNSTREAPAAATLLVAAATSPTVVPLADSLVLVRGVVRNSWGVRKAGARVRIGSQRDTTDAQGRFQVLVPQRQLAEIGHFGVLYRSPADGSSRLSARVALDPARTRPYHITLKKPKMLMGNPKFR